MRVARIVERLPPERGGKEIHAAELSRALAERGVEQHVFFRSGNPVGHGVTCTRTRARPALAGRMALVRYAAWSARAICRAHRERPFDLVHVHGDFVEAAAATALARMPGVPAVLSIHGALSRDHGHDAARLGTFSAMQLVLAVSRNVAADVSRIGVSAPVVVRSSGVRDAFFTPATGSRLTDTVVTVGRLAPVKGLETLLAAHDLLAEQQPLRWLVIAGGSDRYAERVRAEIAKRPAIRCFEEHDSIRLAEHVARAGVFVLPSANLAGQREGMPTSVLEALAAGTPVVTTDAGGAAELALAGEDVRVVPAGDASALARAIAETLAGRGSRRRVPRRSPLVQPWSVVAAEVHAHYDEVVREARRPGAVFAVPWLEVGGAEHMALSLSSAAADRGLRTVVAGAPGSLVDEVRPPIAYAPLRFGRSPGTIAHNALALAGACIRVRPVAVNSHHVLTGVSARLATAIAGVSARHVITYHGSEKCRHDPIVALLGPIVADALLPVADNVRDDVVRFTLPAWRHRFRVVTAGVEPAPPTVSRAERTIGVIARLVARKGHTDLFHAWAAVADELRAEGWRIELWGDGPDRGRLEDLARELGIAGDLRFAGSVLNAGRRLGRFPLIVLPSRREGRPLVLIEAMAAGCAIVATALPGCTEILGVDGAAMLVPPADPAALAVALREVITEPGKRASLAEAALRRFGARFTRERMLAIYASELGLPTPAPHLVAGSATARPSPASSSYGAADPNGS